MEATADGPALTVQGLSELVRGQGAVLYDSLEAITRMDPREVLVCPDDSPRYRRCRLWLEALGYQQQAVVKALNPASVPRRCTGTWSAAMPWWRSTR